MGGMFDFDGNGKTTLDEQYVAYKIYEETIKEENDSSLSYHKPAKYSYTNNNTRLVEEHLAKRRKREIITATTAMMVPPFVPLLFVVLLLV